MNYCAVGKNDNEIMNADGFISSILIDYSKEVYGFTKKEFDSIFEYDVLNIMAFFYAKMDIEHKDRIIEFLEQNFQ